MSDQTFYRPATATNSLAVVSLIFGILGWTLLPFIGAIVGIICGHLARGEIRRSHVDNRPEGDGMAVAGLVLGYSQLLLSVLAIFLIIAMLVFGLAIGHWH
jgi:hypothetical protein